MARKNVIHAFQMINSGDASADITSNPTSVVNLDVASIFISWTGTPVGEITVQAQQRKSNEDLTEADWFDIDLGATVTVDNTESEHQILFKQVPFTDIRVKYTSTSGTGTLNAVITSKQIGG
jgi:hypothetical protein